MQHKQCAAGSSMLDPCRRRRPRARSGRTSEKREKRQHQRYPVRDVSIVAYLRAPASLAPIGAKLSGGRKSAVKTRDMPCFTCATHTHMHTSTHPCTENFFLVYRSAEGKNGNGPLAVASATAVEDEQIFTGEKPSCLNNGEGLPLPAPVLVVFSLSGLFAHQVHWPSGVVQSYLLCPPFFTSSCPPFSFLVSSFSPISSFLVHS